MTASTILINANPPVYTVTLNRPERRNAITPQMLDELLAALDDAAHSEARVFVLTGAGDAFCAGLDLSILQSMNDRSPAEHRADAERIARVFRALYEFSLPTIAAVHGPAIAGGTGLATICDFTLATPAAKFGYTEARIGFVPALVSAFLVLQIGEKAARDLLLTARIFDATEALRLGLVSEIVAPDQLKTRVDTLAQQLIANSAQSMAATKRLLAAQNKAWLDAAIAAALEANAASRETADFREGVAAFLQKRSPRWSR